MKRYDIGAIVGANISLYQNLLLFTNAQIGFIDTLKAENRKVDINMYNIITFQ